MNDIVHAAVRRDLARMEVALHTFTDGDGARARDLERAWQSLGDKLHHHHVGEDTFVFPYLRDLGPTVIDTALVEAMVSEHRAMSNATEAASAAVHVLAQDPTAANAAVAAQAVASAATVTDGHLRHEETDVVPIVDARLETPEWKAVERNLRKGTPKQAGEMFAWLQDGAEPEIQQALNGVMPVPVRYVLTTVFGRAYRREIAPVWK
jgi:hypothetical protein